MNLRRDFLKTGAIVAAAAPAILKGAEDTKPIKVGLVGCGGRGTGAASQALKADDYAELVAMADIEQSRIDDSIGRLRKVADKKVKVAPDRMFNGLDAYEKLINSGVDVVLLATPPGFRPSHLRAAVEAGKHVFCEKPVAVDGPGIRHGLETTRMAKENNISGVAGFCWRYSNYIKDTMAKVFDGSIGDVIAYYATYYTNPVKPMPPASERPAGMSDVEWQIRNWYNFTWLCGDRLVAQAVHNADKIMWIVNDQPPASVMPVGGRAVPADAGKLPDHLGPDDLWPNGYRVFLANRQSTGCYNGTHDDVMGTDATLVLGVGNTRIETPDGKVKWQFEGEAYDMYQKEHDVLFASIRSGKPKNDDLNLATSTLLAIMGRNAAYSGQQLTWEQVLNSQVSLVPKPVDWTAKHEVPGLAIPGRTTMA